MRMDTTLEEATCNVSILILNGENFSTLNEVSISCSNLHVLEVHGRTDILP